MNNYEFNLLSDGKLSGQGFGNGNNAVEAFEYGVSNGTVYLPEGAQVEVVAINQQTGLAIKFEAGRDL